MALVYRFYTFLEASWRTYCLWKQEATMPLFDILRRYGVLYFFVIFSMNVANLFIIEAVPELLEPVNFTPMLILEVTLSCRLFLSLHGPRKSAIYFWAPPVAQYQQDTLEPDAAPGNSENRNSQLWPDTDKKNPTNELQCAELSPSFVERI
ncbi:hypothetical protein BD779DRAFT_1683710 [Infundibulicybe gibba]|nr:hypothetical protein BD779DRAFT_1683710 [Infundibulicybe gibba]